VLRPNLTEKTERTSDMTVTTATIETLTAEVRVLMVGSRQVTLSVAKQLDRTSFFEDGPGAITPFGRVKTGAKATLERLKPEKARLSGSYYDDDFETYKAEPYLEVIGRSNRERDCGALVIFEVARSKDADQAEDKAALAEWAKLPLIVLAGLR